MRSTLLVILLSLLIISGVFNSRGGIMLRNSPELRVGIDLGHSNLHTNPSEIANFTAFIAEAGGDVQFSRGPLNQSFLNSVNMLIVSSPTIAYDPTELGLLKTWHVNGGKLWLSASYENTTGTANSNAILRNINSTLGFEYGYASDEIFNVNASTISAESVLLPLINHQKSALGGLSNNIRTLFAYKPVPILGYNGNYTRFNSTPLYNATWIAETASSAKLYNSSATTLLALTPGSQGRMPIVAAEESAGYKTILTGYPIFSTFKESFIYNQTQPQDNRILVSNIVSWLTGVAITTEPESQMPRIIRGTGRPLVLIDQTYLNQHTSDPEILPLEALTSDLGLSFGRITSYSPNSLKGAAAVLIQAPHLLIPPADAGEVSRWFQEGNKTLILASMADYAHVGNATESNNLNRLLSLMNSSLRFEQGDLLDPETNLAGNAYLSISSNINHGSVGADALTRNVRSILQQYATIIIGWNGTNAVPLEPRLPSMHNVTWIARTSNSSTIRNLGLGYPLLAHKDGEIGSFVTVAEEKSKNGGRIILLGGPLFSGFSGLLNYPTLYGYPTDNIIFIRNILSRLLVNPVTGTSIQATATPHKLQEGEPVTINVDYYVFRISVSNISDTKRTPISPANITITLRGATLNTIRLPNGTYTANTLLNSTGEVFWSVNATARNYQSQATNGTLQVNAVPTRFTIYVLGIPIIIFIAVTVVALARKTR